MYVSSNMMPLLMAICLSKVLGGATDEHPLRPLGSTPPVQGLTILESIPTPGYFNEWFVRPGQPVLFRGALENPDFTYTAYNLWTDDYLREKHGNTVVTYEFHKKETRNSDDLKFGFLDNFLERYTKDDIYLVLDLKGKTEMLDELYLPPWLRCGGFQNHIMDFNMWMSGGGTRSVLHYDSYENINCLMDGTKDIVFFDKRLKDSIEADGFNFEKGYSTMDVDRVDLKTFPKFESLPWIKAHMEKGDCLFIPEGWYHQVNSYGERNLAVNVWYRRPPWFNASDCVQPEHSHSVPLSGLNLKDGQDDFWFALFGGFVDQPYINVTDLSAIVKEESTATQMFDYFNTNNDEHISWKEVFSADPDDFEQRFPPLDILKEELVAEEYDMNYKSESSGSDEAPQQTRKSEL